MKKEGSKRKHLSVRRYTQLLAAVMYNCNLPGFWKGEIYQGDIKGVCVPGLNCYSCPGAVVACPLGSLQSGLASFRYKIPFYVIGTLLLFGLLCGRLICGFLCPFGFLQELLYKIPGKKIKKSKFTRALSKLKYIVLLAFVIVIPLVKFVPAFCKYICPAGTLAGGIPLVIQNETLREMVGALFSWKVFVLAAVLLVCIFCYRAFCRFLCPLGALYSFFNPIAFFGIKVDESKCTHCKTCVHQCKMDVKKVCDGECIQCGECKKHCPHQAISFGYKGIIKPPAKKEESISR
ncbi:MAG: 4Fe-4S binding protein [Clostridia bacterium]|nr:4Fe-4S binding protein [Clostridia bacterium]